MPIEIQTNQLPGPDRPEPTIDDVQRQVLQFVREEAGFAQVFTINKDGFPVGRTMVAAVEDDWSATFVQRRVHKRLGQLLRNPKLEIMWIADPAPENRIERPHVYDTGLNAPRAVFLRGIAEPLDPAETIRRFRRRTEYYTARGNTRVAEYTDEQITEDLVGFHIRPIQVRAEGFGSGAQSYTWTV